MWDHITGSPWGPYSTREKGRLEFTPRSIGLDVEAIETPSWRIGFLFLNVPQRLPQVRNVPDQASIYRRPVQPESRRKPVSRVLLKYKHLPYSQEPTMTSPFCGLAKMASAWQGTGAGLSFLGSNTTPSHTPPAPNEDQIRLDEGYPELIWALFLCGM